MNTYRRHAVMAGALYVLGTVAGVLSVVVVGGFADETFLDRIAADPSRVVLGALLILLMGIALTAMTIFLYPVLRKDSELLALGMIVFRGALEGSWYLLSAFSWLLLAAIGTALAATGADASSLRSLGEVVIRSSEQLGDFGTILFVIGAACLYTSFYRSRLIPRWLSGWGLLAALPYLAYALLHLFDAGSDLGVLQAPLAIQEMVMGLWLIVKGFRVDAVEALDGAITPDTRST